MRPAQLARDDSPHVPVVIHAVEEEINRSGCIPEYVVLLQPTSPLRQACDIDGAVELARANNANFVVSVSEPDAHPYLVKRIQDDCRLFPLVEAPGGYLRRQDLPKVVAPNGAVYVARYSTLKVNKTFSDNDGTYGFMMPAERSLDIDTSWDLKLARLVLCGSE